MAKNELAEVRGIKNLKEGMWKLPENAIPTPEFQAMYEDLSKRMCNELLSIGKLGPVEEMVIERTAYLYVWIREKEAANGFEHERNHKEINQLWQSFAAMHKAAAVKPVDADTIRKHVLEQVGAVLSGVLAGLPEDIQDQLRPVVQAAFADQDW